MPMTILDAPIRPGIHHGFNFRTLGFYNAEYGTANSSICSAVFRKPDLSGFLHALSRSVAFEPRVASVFKGPEIGVLVAGDVVAHLFGAVAIGQVEPNPG